MICFYIFHVPFQYTLLLECQDLEENGVTFLHACTVCSLVNILYQNKEFAYYQIRTYFSLFELASLYSKQLLAKLIVFIKSFYLKHRKTHHQKKDFVLASHKNQLEKKCRIVCPVGT